MADTVSTDRVLSALGLAKRAGKVITGTQLVQDAVRHKKALLVLAASDISDNSKKKLVNSCDFYNVEFTQYSDMAALSAALGQKKAITSAAITDENFKILIKKQLSATAEND